MHSIAGAILILAAVYAHYQERAGDAAIPLLLLIAGAALLIWDFRAVIPWRSLKQGLAPFDLHRGPPAP